MDRDKYGHLAVGDRLF